MSQRTKLYIALAVLAAAATIFTAQLLLAPKHATPADVERQQQAILDSLPENDPPPPAPRPDNTPADTSHSPRKAPGP